MEEESTTSKKLEMVRKGYINNTTLLEQYQMYFIYTSLYKYQRIINILEY